MLDGNRMVQNLVMTLGTGDPVSRLHAACGLLADAMQWKKLSYVTQVRRA